MGGGGEGVILFDMLISGGFGRFWRARGWGQSLRAVRRGMVCVRVSHGARESFSLFLNEHRVSPVRFPVFPCDFIIKSF